MENTSIPVATNGEHADATMHAGLMNSSEIGASSKLFTEGLWQALVNLLTSKNTSSDEKISNNQFCEKICSNQFFF